MVNLYGIFFDFVMSIEEKYPEKGNDHVLIRQKAKSHMVIFKIVCQFMIFPLRTYVTGKNTHNNYSGHTFHVKNPAVPTLIPCM